MKNILASLFAFFLVITSTAWFLSGFDDSPDISTKTAIYTDNKNIRMDIPIKTQETCKDVMRDLKIIQFKVKDITFFPTCTKDEQYIHILYTPTIDV